MRGAPCCDVSSSAQRPCQAHTSQVQPPPSPKLLPPGALPIIGELSTVSNRRKPAGTARNCRGPHPPPSAPRPCSGSLLVAELSCSKRATVTACHSNCSNSNSLDDWLYSRSTKVHFINVKGARCTHRSGVSGDSAKSGWSIGEFVQVDGASIFGSAPEVSTISRSSAPSTRASRPQHWCHAVLVVWRH